MSVAGRLFRELSRRVPAGLARLAGRPAAVLFHGVEPLIVDPRIQNNHHETHFFRGIAQALKTHFDVLPLAALDDVLKAPDKHSRALFLMSDDGYTNNLTTAADILEEMALPWTLFVSTRHIDTRERNPVFIARLFALFAAAGAYRLPKLKEAVVISDSHDYRDVAADKLVNALKKLNGPDARQAIVAMIQILTPERLAELFLRFRSEEFMSWDQIRQLAQRGVTIGAHAHWHWPLNEHQSDDYLREQATLPKARIEAELGQPCTAFAYPFGTVSDVSRAGWQAVRDAGYAHAFTTLAGSLDGKMNPYLLPRYGLGLRETRPASLIPLLRTGNARLLDWQKSLAA
jgi:peptidoglycan/xylan/chitin deacetylase (PgdA/CDA1 family)